MSPQQEEPLPVPPFVRIDGMVNVRDVGGYEIPSSSQHNGRPRSFRRGLIYRGGEPSRITPEGRSTFAALGIKKVFDIRTKYELPPTPSSTENRKPGDGSDEKPNALRAVQQPITELDGAERVHLDVLGEVTDEERDASTKAFEKYGKNTTERFIAKCIEVLDKGPTLRPIFSHLAQPDPAPIYLHCTAGKDRTGTVIMLLFRLVGVPAETVAAEYELTNLGLREQAPKIVEQLLKHPGMGLDADTVKQIMVAKREYIRGLCGALEDRYGGAERYFREHLGMSEEEVGALKRALVVNEPGIFASGRDTTTPGKVRTSSPTSGLANVEVDHRGGAALVVSHARFVVGATVVLALAALFVQLRVGIPFLYL